VFSLLSALSIAVVQPIFQLLFDTDSHTVASTSNNVLEHIKNAFYTWISVSIVHNQTKQQALVNVGILLVAIFVVKNIAKYIGSTINTLLNERLIRSIRDLVFNTMTHLSMDFFTSRKTGELVSIVTNDVAAMQASVTAATLTLVREPLQIVLFLLMLLSLSPYLTIIAFSTSIVALVLIRIATITLRKYAQRMQSVTANFTSVLQEAVSGIRIIKAFSMEERISTLFSEQTRAFVRAASKYQRVYDIVPATSEMFAIVALVVVLYVGGQQVFSGDLQSHELITFLFALFSIMSPITNVASLPAQIQRGMVSADVVFAILDNVPSVRSGNRILTSFEHSFIAENVSFSYKPVGDQQRHVLQNISFCLEKGKKIALVGSSGSGKSTMCDLVIRLYDPQYGSLMVDGVNVRDYTLESYRTLFGVVSQESVLFNDTIANNIRYGAGAIANIETITHTDIEVAARIANATEFIEKLPHGYDTSIGDRGTLLSGGQKQRLAIARALVGNPAILVFDEATSALDSESERLVQDAINHVLENRTAIIIAHRLSTILSADEILVFESGRIVERGTHGELLALDGVYKKLYDIQFRTGEDQSNNNVL
jgi:ATP-binding cassette, subfamily B, bacterial MsbA